MKQTIHHNGELTVEAVQHQPVTDPNFVSGPYSTLQVLVGDQLVFTRYFHGDGHHMDCKEEYLRIVTLLGGC